jgi:hypothetical protein
VYVSVAPPSTRGWSQALATATGAQLYNSRATQSRVPCRTFQFLSHDELRHAPSHILDENSTAGTLDCVTGHISKRRSAVADSAWRSQYAPCEGS